MRVVRYSDWKCMLFRMRTGQFHICLEACLTKKGVYRCLANGYLSSYVDDLQSATRFLCWGCSVHCFRGVHCFSGAGIYRRTIRSSLGRVTGRMLINAKDDPVGRIAPQGWMHSQREGN